MILFGLFRETNPQYSFHQLEQQTEGQLQLQKTAPFSSKPGFRVLTRT